MQPLCRCMQNCTAMPAFILGFGSLWLSKPVPCRFATCWGASLLDRQPRPDAKDRSTKPDL